MLAALTTYLETGRPKVHVWDLQSGTKREIGPWASVVHFLPSGQLMVRTVQEGVRFYDPTSGEERSPPFTGGQ